MEGCYIQSHARGREGGREGDYCAMLATWREGGKSIYSPREGGYTV